MGIQWSMADRFVFEHTIGYARDMLSMGAKDSQALRLKCATMALRDYEHAHMLGLSQVHLCAITWRT